MIYTPPSCPRPGWDLLVSLGWAQPIPYASALPSLRAPAGSANPLQEALHPPVGGSEPFRSYSETYLSKGLLLIFVVDSADHSRLPEAKKYLHQLIAANPVLPLVVFANKQDLEAAYHITDIHEALALSEVGNDRKMFLFGTHVTKNGSEIPSTMQDAKDLIAQLAADVQ
ncbi:PREDICTED: ADP-ribosylation factor-like protein 9 isoform X2 [Cercocebus atys]|uniref:ADP-ribosylation factor-like protein 9 isoform X2 n=1 Tax=Cercocebus atys TaxID=9531 RepID=UPI0005F4F2A5|nr:PREDICTED: ADP-ribosylation factor-like protein 9 isoform X2 [Cercocebus atys]